jgi:hypothetical protein
VSGLEAIAGVALNSLYLKFRVHSNISSAALYFREVSKFPSPSSIPGSLGHSDVSAFDWFEYKYVAI